MPIVLRPCSVSEAGAVLALWTASGAKPTRTDDVDSVVQLLRGDDQALIVADDGGQLIGSVIAAWDGWRGSVYRLVVAPSHRRRGLAQRLLQEAEARLHARGARRRSWSRTIHRR
jgi:ribosomal protein S18 acetylase RimI-like enzyme